MREVDSIIKWVIIKIKDKTIEQHRRDLESKDSKIKNLQQQ